MKLSAFLLPQIILLFCAASASAQATFQIGDHVQVGSTNSSGSIIAVGAPQANGGTLVKVHLDSLGASFPDTGVWYDTAMSRVTKQGGQEAPAGAQPGGTLGAAAPAGAGPPGLGPPPSMNAPANPGYGPAQ